MTAMRRQTEDGEWAEAATGASVCTRAFGLGCRGRGNEDSVGFGFSEREVVVSDADFEGIAEWGEAA